MSHRTDRVASTMVTEISRVLTRDFEPPAGCLITVMRAEVAPDLKHATVFVSILPEHATKTTLGALIRFTRHVQMAVNKKFTMKFVPKIRWELDFTTRKYAAIDEALKQ